MSRRHLILTAAVLSLTGCGGYDYSCDAAKTAELVRQQYAQTINEIYADDIAAGQPALEANQISLVDIKTQEEPSDSGEAGFYTCNATVEATWPKAALERLAPAAAQLASVGAILENGHLRHALSYESSLEGSDKQRVDITLPEAVDLSLKTLAGQEPMDEYLEDAPDGEQEAP
ncbi:MULTISPECIES: hypothetical protein [Pseudomonas]|uniref:Lipoprotein n=1 Tax=Pseudomonas benzopyrenica TaxID=2993566 RepID=A0ABZ2FP07_9PSED|nr:MULTISPECIES: hypothetical protein [Pseudomonas]KXJ32708.1 hypothetical protein AX284_09620 [Pseudomonas sp. HUK17]MCD4865064.1 hypothetical protein [Pseudomonas sp. PLB05]MDC7830522.1 hypothetical protein [Pseudomonas benzopyrenica]MXS20610.1 hypothetical protein [Pseudomonas oryzihabitans]UUW71768.1 hypothetical protein NRG74_22245 [Pseudomonas psychrotolerans]